MAGLVEIKADLANLENDLKEHGIDVPKPPKTNHFGPKVKHVYKTRIKQAHPPGPLIVAVKGLNNLLRQWGKRLIPGCPGQDGVSAPGSGSSRSGSSDAGYAGATPTALVGTEVAVVATLPLCTENSASDDDTFSDISADDIPA